MKYNDAECPKCHSGVTFWAHLRGIDHSSSCKDICLLRVCKEPECGYRWEATVEEVVGEDKSC